MVTTPFSIASGGDFPGVRGVSQGVRVMTPGDVQGVGVARQEGVRANPTDFGSQIGSALEQAGNVIQSLGGVADHLQKQRQDSTDAIGVARYRIEANQAYNNDYTKAQENIQPGAPDFYKNFQSQMTTDAAQRLADFQKQYGISPDGMQKLKLVDLDLQGDYGSKAVTYGHNEAVRYLGETTTKNINDVLAGAAAHGDFATARKAIDDSVSAAAGMLGPAGVDNLKNGKDGVNASMVKAFSQWYDTLSQSGFKNEAELNAKKAQFDKEIGSLDISDGAKDLLRQDFAQKSGTAYAKQHPEVAVPKAAPTAVPAATDLIKGFESYRSGAYWDVNHYRTGYGSDTMTGADGSVQTVQKGAQTTQADANRDLSRRVGDIQTQLKSQLGPAWDKLSPGAQSAMTSVAYNYGSLPKRVATAAMTGDPAHVANAILSLAGDNAGVNAKRRRAEAAVALGESIPGQSAVSDGTVSTGAPDRWPFNQMTSDAWQQAQDHAGVQVRTDIAQGQQDILTSYQRTGTYNGQEPTQQQYQSAFGYDKGNQEWQDFQQKKVTAQTINSFNGMSNEQINSTVTQAQMAVPAGPGAAAADANAAAMTTAASQVLTARSADPGGYVAMQNPKVAAAWQGYDPQKPETAQAAIAASLAAQTAIGIDPFNQAPFPKQLASQASAVISDYQRPPDQRIAALAAIVDATPDPTQRAAIINQLVDAGAPPAIETVLRAYERGDTGAARRLMTAASADPAKLPGGSVDKAKDFDKAVSDALVGDGTIGKVLYGYEYGDPTGAKMGETDYALAKNAARLAMAGGMDQSTAITQAVNDIMGPVVPMRREHVNAVVTKDINQDALESGMAQSIGQVQMAAQDYNAEAMKALPADASPETKAIFTATHIHEMNHLLSNGAWRNYGNGFAFYDPDLQGFVADIKGNVLTFSAEQLTAMGAGAAPKPSVPAGRFNPPTTLPGAPLRQYAPGYTPGGGG